MSMGTVQLSKRLESLLLSALGTSKASRLRERLRCFLLTFHFRPPCPLSGRDSPATGCRDCSRRSRCSHYAVLLCPSCFLGQANSPTSSSRHDAPTPVGI